MISGRGVRQSRVMVGKNEGGVYDIVAREDYLAVLTSKQLLGFDKRSPGKILWNLPLP